ncbi:hypothetical protein B7P43_G14626 [Cryptotermes secundus]|uniref:Uncharacterized protein n=1 Tax=Cryptotermes secundus TaxID=105785 RepID=A0A2J7PPP6_9NEOP|nr:hypothetical protein B7P43_G14626 [Cryptotermes secundus]
MRQCTVGTQFGVAGPFPWSDQENRYLLIDLDYFIKWPESRDLAYTASTHGTMVLTAACLVFPTCTKGKSPKLQSSWEDSYNLVTRITDVVYRNQLNPRSRLMVVHLDRLAHY